MNKDKILRGILILVYLVCGAKLLLMWLEPSPTEKLNQELKDISYVQQTAVAEVTTKANLKFTNTSKFLETNIGLCHCSPSWRNALFDDIRRQDNIGAVNVIMDSQINVFNREFADMFKETESLSKRVSQFVTFIVMCQQGYADNNDNYFPVLVPNSLPTIRFYQNGSIMMITQKCGLLKNTKFKAYRDGRIKAEDIKNFEKIGYVTVLAELYPETIHPGLILGNYRFHPIRVVFKDCLDNAVFQCNGNGSYGVSKL